MLKIDDIFEISFKMLQETYTRGKPKSIKWLGARSKNKTKNLVRESKLENQSKVFFIQALTETQQKTFVSYFMARLMIEEASVKRLCFFLKNIMTVVMKGKSIDSKSPKGIQITNSMQKQTNSTGILSTEPPNNVRLIF